MTKQPRKPEPGEVVKFGFPSWLGKGGLIVFGAKRFEQSKTLVQQSDAITVEPEDSGLEAQRKTPPNDSATGI